MSSLLEKNVFIIFFFELYRERLEKFRKELQMEVNKKIKGKVEKYKMRSNSKKEKREWIEKGEKTIEENVEEENKKK
jgi:hypothetical protein